MLTMPDFTLISPTPVGTLPEGPHTYDSLVDVDCDVLDRAAYGATTDDLIEINPNDVTIIHPDLENPEYRFEMDGMDWVNSVDLSEPVEFSINQQGQICLEDGHHRYFAAKIRGENLTGTIEVKGNPIKTLLYLQRKELEKEDNLSPTM
ncbi:hypothetical protein [Neptuniibacter sp. QD37_11]|uniref:hypothetical protein n=1 Tax=Neptuniibacter sp. QD37_11 TaxID=3398209 RepID=UPI0039F4A13B